MNATLQNNDKYSLSLWMRAIRPFSYTAVIAPVLIGAMSARVFSDSPNQWHLLPLILIATILLQMGGNLRSEYYDYANNVDTKDTYGSTRVLVDGLMTPKSILRASNIAFLAGASIGLILTLIKGDLLILWLGLIGLVCGSFYGAKPLRLKYIALGDLTIFLSFGPLLVFGSYFTISGEANPYILLSAAPISFLVIAILHANNTRDIKHDRIANIKTVANILGVKGSIYYYNSLVLGAYIALILLALFNILPYWTLLAFISLPSALKNIKQIRGAKLDNPEIIENLDVATAQNHLLFGLLMSIGLLVASL